MPNWFPKAPPFGQRMLTKNVLVAAPSNLTRVVQMPVCAACAVVKYKGVEKAFLF